MNGLIVFLACVVLLVTVIFYACLSDADELPYPPLTVGQLIGAALLFPAHLVVEAARAFHTRVLCARLPWVR